MNASRRGILMLVAALIAATAHPSAQSSWGIAVLRTGDIFFCDQTRDRVWRLSPDGHVAVGLEDTHCRAVAAGSDGLAYGEYIGGSLPASAELGIWRMTPDLHHGWLEPPSSSPDPSIWLTIDRKGAMYSWNGAVNGANLSQIVRRDPSGTAAVVAGGGWGGRDGSGANAQFAHVGGLAIAPDGSLLVADSGNLRRVDPFGNVRTEAVGVLSGRSGGDPDRTGLWGNSMGVAADFDGSALVVDDAARRIVRIAHDGHTTVLWRPTGIMNALTGGRWGWHPAGIAMMGSTCYVLEEWPMPAVAADLIGNPRLLQLRSDGSTTTVAVASNWMVRLGAALLALALASWIRTSMRPRISNALPLPPDAVSP